MPLRSGPSARRWHTSASAENHTTALMHSTNTLPQLQSGRSTTISARRWRSCASAETHTNTAPLMQLMATQAHPPVAGGQPFPPFLQHQLFLATLQPAIQLENPALQS